MRAYAARVAGSDARSLIGVLRKADPTFRVKRDQLQTAVNDGGFEIDIIRRQAAGDDPHPMRMSGEGTGQTRLPEGLPACSRLVLQAQASGGLGLTPYLVLGVLFFSPPAALRLLLALPLALGLLLGDDFMLLDDLLLLLALGLLLCDAPDLDEEEEEELRDAIDCSLGG